jgi:hypothetical protein
MTFYLNYWPLAFLLEIVIGYFAIVHVAYKSIDAKSARLSVLCTRCAAFLPFYALFIYVSLLVPTAFEGLLIPITIMEGYAFYTFAVMIITNLGGPDATVALLEEKKGEPLFMCNCCPCYWSNQSDAKAFYNRVTWAVWHFFITRTVLTIISTICFYANSDAGDKLAKVFSVIVAVILFYSIMTFVLFYHKVYSECKNVFGLGKLFIIKISVGAITLGFLITSFIGSAGADNYNDDNAYTAAHKLTRAYCVVVLIAFSIISVPHFFVFSVTMRSPGAKVVIPEVEVPNFMAFLGLVFCSWLDVVDQLTLYESDLSKSISCTQNNDNKL